MRARLATVVIAAIVVFPPGVDAQGAVRRAIAVPAQELAPALRALVKDLPYQLVYPSELLANRSSPGASGELTFDEALVQILRGTGLTYVYVDELTITLVPDPAAAAPAPVDHAAEHDTSAVRGESGRAVAATPPQKTPLEEIIVTGSLIPGMDLSSQLVTALSTDEIQLRIATDAPEVLESASQNQPLEVANSFAGAGTGLASYASLRSLGSESTLVLFGGRRIVNNPYQNKAVDLNTVPTVLIDRVDVLSDGASAIYGSDAIAGVINFITREEMQGFDVAINTLQPTAVGGEEYGVSTAVGFGSLAADGWNFHVGGAWRDRSEIRASDRRFAATTYLPERGVDRTAVQTFPASFVQFDPATQRITLAANPYFPDCAPPRSIAVDDTCRYDLAKDLSVQNAEAQRSGLAKLTGRFGEWQGALEYFRARSSVRSQITPQSSSSFVIGPDNPFYPGLGLTPGVAGLDPTQPVHLEMRFAPVGRRSTESVSDTDRVLGEIEGRAAGWSYQGWTLHSTSKVRLQATGTGFIREQVLHDGFAGANGAPFLNPFGEQSDDAVRYLRDHQFKGTVQAAVGELTMAGLQLSRESFAVRAGRVSTALALEYGHERARFDRAAVQNELVGFFAPGEDVAAERDRYSVTGELLIPLSRRVAVDASVRHDHYQAFGGAFNPKILVNYAAAPGLSLHGSYNEGFRVPTLYELHQPRTFGFTPTRRNDPLLCPAGVPDLAAGAAASRDCNSQFYSLQLGNPDLDPVESQAFTAGFDWKPLDGVALGVDYWSYEVDHSIGFLSDVAIFNDAQRFSSYIVRCSQADPVLRAEVGCNPQGTAQLGGGDPIAYIVQILANVGRTRTSGLDLSLRWSKQLAYGALSLDYRGTYVDAYEFQRVPGDPFVSKAGVFIDGAPVIRYSHYATLSWDRGPWSAQLQNRHLGGYADFNDGRGADRSYAFYNRVDRYSLWNLALSYKHDAAWTITALIRNALDEDPPFTNKLAGLSTGYDERLTDPTGRAFALTVSVSFGNLGDLF